MPRDRRQEDPIAYHALVHIRKKYETFREPTPPDVAAFLGVFEDDADTVEHLIEKLGVEPGLVLGDVFRQHGNLLVDFHPSAFRTVEEHRGTSEASSASAAAAGQSVVPRYEGS